MRVLRGTRALEAALIADVRALCQPGRLDVGALARPVRVIVPGRSVRLHLSTALAGGGGLVGLTVTTLQAVALEILDRAGVAPPGSASAFDVLVRRFAREEDALSRVLEHLTDGYAAVTAAVRDLVDAGLEEGGVEALEERLETLPPVAATLDERERAAALLRVAARTLGEMEELDIGRAGALYQRARDAALRDPEGALPARALLVYGLAELPGLALELLETLVSRIPSVVYVDLPPDPADPLAADLGGACTRRLRERLSGAADLDDEEGGPPPPMLTLFQAQGATEEAREVAHRCRELIDAGVPPEQISVVARDLRGYRVPLRVHLRRLGVPYSGVGALGPAGGMGRRIHAMLELLRERGNVAMDRWLDAQGPRGRVGQRAVQPKRWRPTRLWDLRLALRSLGATRLQDVSQLDVETLLGGRERWPLPVRRGVWDAGAEPDEGVDPDDVATEEEDEDDPTPQGRQPGTVVLSRRTLDADILRTAVVAAGDLVARFARWPEVATIREHRRELESLLKQELGWDQDYLGMPPVFGALSALEREFPRHFQLRLDELVLLAARTLFDIGAGPLGGDGGGVAVLSAGEARGRTARHLFVLGLNRDVFPKIVQEDPLLPDSLRRPLLELLPDLPLRHDAFDAERYLFASLVSSADHVTLSWQVVDDDNRARPPSPLVERLRLALSRDQEDRDKAEIPLIPTMTSLGPRPPGRLLPAEDHALLSALHGDRASWGAVLPLVLSEVHGDKAGGLDARTLAAARVRVLEEIDPERRGPRKGRIGPYFGFLGELRDRADPRRNPLFITTLERMSGCPWQVFVERLLHVEPPLDPMQELPGVDDRMVGNVVHLVLQRVVERALPTGLPSALDAARVAEPVAVPWPDAEGEEALIQAAASEVLAEAGLGLSGFVRALMDRARPYLEAARAQDWSGAALSVLGVEVEGELSVRDAAGEPRPIRFKADRVDLDAGGALRLTDYKTGRGPARAKKADKRRDQMLRAAREGQHLQAVAYAAAAGDEAATGRYLYLKPELEDEQRRMEVRADDAGFHEALEGAARATLSAWDRGSFFPRLVDPAKKREPPRCARCEVAQACNRGDSGARGRLLDWAERARALGATGDPLPPEEQALYAVWSLGREGATEEDPSGGRS